jgi:hypothetical protein
MTALDKFRTSLLGDNYWRNYHCRCGVSVDGGKTLKDNEYYVCHARLNTYATYKPTHVYSSLAVVNQDHYDMACEFWSFILDPKKSPWKCALQGREIIYSDDNRPIGFVLSAKAPAQVIGNLCIASRIPQEHLPSLRLWCSLRKHLDDYEALALTTILSMDSSGNPLLEVKANNHFPFPNSIKAESLRNATPQFTARLMSEGGQYFPCNQIWSALKKKKVTDPYDYYANLMNDNKEYEYKHALKEMLKNKVEYTGSFKKLHKTTVGDHAVGCVPLPRLIEIVKENRACL